MDSVFSSPESVAPGLPVTVVFYNENKPMAVTASVQTGKPFTLSTNDKNASALAAGRRAMLILQDGLNFAKAEAQISDCRQDGDAWVIEAGDFGWEEVDRRRYPRYTVALPVQVRAVVEVEGGAELMHFAGVTEDMSLGGAWVRSESRLDSGSLVEFQTDLTPGTTIRCLAIVAWSSSDSQDGFGVEFLDFLGGSRYYLHGFLRNAA